MSPFKVLVIIELSDSKVYLNCPYSPHDMDVDLLEKVFSYRVDTSLNTEQARSACLNVIEYLSYDLEHDKATRLIELAITIECVMSKAEITKIKEWSKTL